MATYLLKFSSCLLVFWLVYVFLLERQNMHRFKRFYLLGSIIIALIIPLLTITYYIEPVLDSGTFDLYSDYQIPTILAADNLTNEIKESTNYLPIILWSIYSLGVAILSVRFFNNLFKLYRKISECENLNRGAFIYVLLSNYRVPHSFFKYIFLNKLKFENNDIPAEVLLHEETHAKQLHSIDILLLEVLQILFWFHPLVYVLKHHVKLNHEFLADEAVLNGGINTKTYQNILLQFSSNTHGSQLSSAINYSSFKKRFTVMKTQTSKTRIWLSMALLLPIIATLIYGLAEREYVEKEYSENVDAILEELNEANKLNLNYVDDNSKSNSFLVTVEKNGNTIELKCENGCKWSHLTLEPNSDGYIINDYGFSEGQTLDTDKFAFSIKPNASGVSLNGLTGTAWVDLAFSLKENKIQAINQLGMTATQIKGHERSRNTLSIIAKNDQLFINGKASSLNTYKDDLNLIMKDWTTKDFKSISPDLEISECSQVFLDNLDQAFRASNYFLITIEGSKSLEDIENDAIEAYLKKYKIYKKLQDTSPHYIKKTEAEKQKMEALFSDLGGMYFRMSKANKAKVKRPEAPILPYAKITLNGKTYYKNRHDLTKEERATLPPPPPPANKNSVTIQKPIVWVLVNRNGQMLVDEELATLKEVETKLKGLSNKKVKNRLVSIKYDIEAPKKVIASLEALANKYDFEVFTINASEIPPPPPPSKKSKGGPNYNDIQDTYNPTFLEYIIEMENEGATFYFNGKKITSEKAKSIATNNRGKQTEMITQKDSKGKYIVKLTSSENRQQKVTNKEIATYNNWAKKIHASSKKLSDDTKFYPPINEQDLIKFSDIYKRMSSQQRKQSVAYPFSDLDLKSTEQQRATAKQIAEYNKLAKHYNSILKDKHHRILLKDVEKMKYIYGLMSKEQRKNAEPFPNFPAPPPSPEPVSIEVIEEQKEMIPPPPPPIPEDASPEEIKRMKEVTEKYKRTYAKKYKKQSTDKKAIEVREVPPPPPPTKVAQYKNRKKKTLNEIIKETPKGVESGYEMLENGESHYYTVHKGKKTYYNKDGYITDKKGNVLPPPPPAPESPLDFVIRMAKKNAKFSYEGKQISSDKAIELIKKNNKLNINAKTKTNDGRPLVIISKKPIVIEVKEKSRN